MTFSIMHLTVVICTIWAILIQFHQVYHDRQHVHILRFLLQNPLPEGSSRIWITETGASMLRMMEWDNLLAYNDLKVLLLLPRMISFEPTRFQWDHNIGVCKHFSEAIPSFSVIQFVHFTVRIMYSRQLQQFCECLCGRVPIQPPCNLRFLHHIISLADIH
jgi:hypothetical protein